MTTAQESANDPPAMTVSQLRELLEQTAQLASENARGIAEMRAEQQERATRHDREMAEMRAEQQERATRHDREMAEMRAEQQERAARHDREMAEIRAEQQERAARHDREMAEMRAEQQERAARHDREMAEIRASQDRTEKIVAENSAAMAEMRASQERLDRRFERLMESHRETRGRVSELRTEHDYTSNDVSTLKGWGMEFLCERRPGDFASALKLNSIELFPREKMFTMAIDAAQRGIISGSSANDLHSGDLYFYGRRAEDDIPVYLIVQASFEVKRGDVKRASAQAETLETILRYDGPPDETGIALPVLAGTRLRTDPKTGAVTALWDTTYVEISNGNELTA